jgi:uncharacterized protein (TIGR00369 family)
MNAFAALLAIRPGIDEAGAPICEMTPGDTAMGRPSAMHGGAIATLIEQAGRAAVLKALGNGGDRPAPTITLVSMTVDYLRAGPMRDCRARGEIVKIGGRVANVAAQAWAEDPTKPFAAARLTFLITR